jgi:hypothetical protein
LELRRFVPFGLYLVLQRAIIDGDLDLAGRHGDFIPAILIDGGHGRRISGIDRPEGHLPTGHRLAVEFHQSGNRALARPTAAEDQSQARKTQDARCYTHDARHQPISAEVRDEG